MSRNVRASLFALAALVGCGDDAGTGGGAGGGKTTSSSASSSAAGAGGAGGSPSCDAIECGAGSFCWDGTCHPCDAPIGTRHDVVLTLGDGVEDRTYFVHVPSRYTCGPTPLLVDFHGTAGGPRPEEAYQTDALVSLAESEGAIVVRPRSRSSSRAGFEVFRWDQNPGDLQRNITFTQNLVAALHEQYDIDPARTYASGFSSGANMASQFLGSAAPGLFRGVAPIAGGYWSDPDIAPFDPGVAARVYVATGYRDYLLGTARDLLDALDASGLPEDRLFFRETDTGHDLYAWHFPELFAWLDRGERPAEGTLIAPWVAEVAPTTASFVAAARTASGEILASTSNGEVLRRSTAGAWTLETTTPTPIALTGICATASGSDAFAVGEGRILRHVGGSWSAPEVLPELGPPTFGLGYMNGVACAADGSLDLAGYWAALRSTDAGQTFVAWDMPAGPGYQAQASTVAAGPSGTSVAVGYYDYYGRSTGGADLAAVAHQAVADWWNDVSAAPGGLWLAAGDTGAINRSDDDGLTWFSTSVPASTALYAISFGPDGQAAVAAGIGGQVVYTRDGGVSWSTLATGLDRFFGAVAFVDDDTVLLLGERGAVVRTDLPF